MGIPAFGSWGSARTLDELIRDIERDLQANKPEAAMDHLLREEIYAPAADARRWTSREVEIDAMSNAGGQRHSAIWAERAEKVRETDTDNFVELIRLSGMDPAKHLRFADWSGADFSGCDLRGFDFTGARLLGCDFGNALIAGARFDQAEIDQAGSVADRCSAWGEGSWGDAWGSSWGKPPARRTNLRAAQDWSAHAEGWRKPDTLLPDKHLPAGAVFQDAPFAPEMVVIPPDKFLMGSPKEEPGRRDNEAPQHEVTISKSLAIGRYAVTFAEWDFAQSDKDWRRITRLEARKPDDSSWGRGNRPVINVSWNDARAYMQWLSVKTGREYRLPSEAEWENAARAGTATPFWWGEAITPDQANYDGRDVYEGGGEKGEYRQQTLPVDYFEPNPFGLYQVHGNVWEWCADDQREYETKPVTDDPVGSLESPQRALRGGSWLNYARDVRAAYRNAYVRDHRNINFGFRCARVRK